MNHYSPPSATPPGGGGPSGAPFGAGFFAWLRGLGIGRGGDRWFAGVAGGIAARAGIDPIIVRGVFVVLAVLGGPGILLYLAGWLLLPDQGGRIHLEEVLRGRAGTAAVIATVAVGIFVVLPILLRFVGWTSVGGWSLWDAIGMPGWLSSTLAVLVWIAVIVALGFLVSRLFLEHGRKVREGASADRAASSPSASHDGVPSWVAAAEAAAPAHTAPFAAQGAGDAAPQPAAHPTTPLGAPAADEVPGTPGPRDADWTQRITEGAERVSERATKWGEDVGKQADEWSARYAAEHDRHRLGAAHVVITLALAMLAAGSAAFVALDAGAGSGLVLTAALLGSTAVLAVSLIVAGVRGRHTGWVGFLAMCGIVALLFTSVLPAGTRFQPFGNVDVGDDSTGQVLIAGSTRVDLGAIAPDAEVEVWHLFGNARVVIPADEPAVVTVRMLAGNIDSFGADVGALKTAGPFISRTVDTRTRATQTAPRVTVYMLAGNVTVRESGAGTPRERSSAPPLAADTEADAALRDELAELTAQEAEILKDLGRSGLSSVREQRLESTLSFTRDQIATLEKELVR